MLSADSSSRVAVAPPEPHPAITRFLPPLIFASGVCLALLAIRWGWCDRVRFTGFFGNLLLAWIPLALTFAIQWLRQASDPRPRWLWICAVCWFFFFPNAHYIVTDFVHLGKYSGDGVPKWFDILLFMAHACTGLFIGCTSLWAIESMIAARLGRHAGWLFAVGMLALASFGIYLGRFLRLNSWDVLLRPVRLVEKIAGLIHPPKAFEMAVFSLSFFLFSLAIYWFVTSATERRA
jgi:uncharacterized membrane protein